MKPLRSSLTYHFLFLALNLLLPTAQGDTWWEKSRGGWNEQGSKAAKAAPSESLNESESTLADAEDSLESTPKGKSEYDREIARRKDAAAKARNAVKKPTTEDELQSLNENTEKVQAFEPSSKPAAKAESDLLPVKKEQKEISDAPKKVKRVAKKRSSRRLASIESSEDSLDSGSSSTRVRTKSRTQENIFRIGIVSGVASIAGSNGQTGGSLLNLGLQADFQSKYWGVELDAYYGMGLGLSSSTGSASGMTQSQHGLFLGPKFNYTFGTGDFRFTPKVGAGYGMLGMNMSASSSTSGTTTTASAKSTFSGIYAMAGFDMFLTRWLYINTDYAMSVSASATAENSQNGVTASGTLEGAKFQRVRAGVNFLLGQHLILGGQYYSRSLMIQGVSAPQNFVMGHLGYQF